MAATKIYSVIGSGFFDTSDKPASIVFGCYTSCEQAYQKLREVEANPDPRGVYGVYHLELTFP